MKTIDKKILKTNYYWEFKEFYDKLPDKLPIPEKTASKVNTKDWTTEQEMTEGNTPFSKEEAFALVCKIIKEDNTEKYKSQIIWFKDDSGALCSVYVWHYGDGQYVNVFKYDATSGWDEGGVSYFRNIGNSEPLTPSDTYDSLKLRVEKLEEWAKNLGYK